MSMEPGETVCVTRREFGAAALGCLGAATVTKPARVRQASGFDCRADFYILARRQGRTALVYLDSAATSQRPNVVIDAIADFYRGHNANPSASSHSLARGVVQYVRLAGWAIVPAIAGLFMAKQSLGAPIYVGAAMKIFYDLALSQSFRKLKPLGKQTAS
jgi:hypothetical protein